MVIFQIIEIEGEYNDKTFKEKYLSLGDFNLEKEIEKIKKRLNVRYRESLIYSEVKSIKKDSISLYKNEEEVSHKTDILIKNFFKEYSFAEEYIPAEFKLINVERGIKYIEEVENRWDERGDGRPDIEYDEITFFNSEIRIFTFIFK